MPESLDNRVARLEALLHALICETAITFAAIEPDDDERDEWASGFMRDLRARVDDPDDQGVRAGVAPAPAAADIHAQLDRAEWALRRTLPDFLPPPPRER